MQLRLLASTLWASGSSLETSKHQKFVVKINWDYTWSRATWRKRSYGRGNEEDDNNNGNVNGDYDEEKDNPSLPPLSPLLSPSVAEWHSRWGDTVNKKEEWVQWTEGSYGEWWQGSWICLMKNLDMVRKTMEFGVGNDIFEKISLAALPSSMQSGKRLGAKRAIRKMWDGAFNKSYPSWAGTSSNVSWRHVSL